MDFVEPSLAIGTFLEARDAALLESVGITGVLCLARDCMQGGEVPGVERDMWPLIDGRLTSTGRFASSTGCSRVMRA